MSKTSVLESRRRSDGTLGPVPVPGRLARMLKPEGDCLVFTGTRSRQGYGSIRLDGRMLKAHRVAWELAHGPIPDGLVVMHSCDNPPCCHVEHLSLGTVADNNRDREAKGRSAIENLAAGRAIVIARAAAITHCPQGHPYSGENLRTRTTGARYCLECSRIRDRARRAVKKAEASS